MKMKNKLLSRITLISAALVSVYYFIYLVLCLVGVEALKMIPFALLVLAFVGLPILFRDKLAHRLGRAYRPLHIIFTVLLCFYVISVIVFWAYIGFGAKNTSQIYIEEYAAQNDTGKDTVVLVFGCFTDGMTPSQTLAARLDAAYELLTALPDSICVVSGAQGKTETVPEALAMREYLINRGISDGRIIMEDKAHSTSENIRFTKDLLTQLGLSDKRIIGVSTAFHLRRIEIMARRYGMQIDTCSSPSPNALYYYVSMVREYLSYIKMALFDKAVFITRI